ncbi:hypothetical protein ACE6H2_010308 [Prunus campanulata]
MSSSSSSKKLHVYGGKASFMTWSLHDVLYVAKHHWIPCIFAMGFLFFGSVEFTLGMVPSSSPPFDVGFITTRSLHLLLASKPKLNTFLAGVCGNAYNIHSMDMASRGPPKSHNLSALHVHMPGHPWLLYPTSIASGHIAGCVIASLDMKRMQRWEMAWTFDALNVLQALRLLGTRGHYTIDLAVGVGAGFLFDSLAGKYEESKRSKAPTTNGTKEAFFL